MACDYTVQINGVDITRMIERDSYSVEQIPVKSRTIITIDGVTHQAVLRIRHRLTLGLNPQSAAETASLTAAMQIRPCEVYYFDLHDNLYRYGTFLPDDMEAIYQSRNHRSGLRWNELSNLILEEL